MVLTKEEYLMEQEVDTSIQIQLKDASFKRRSFRLVKVSDDWLPNFPGDYAYVLKSRGNKNCLFWQIQVRGMDDFGMEFRGDIDSVEKLYRQIIKKDVLTKDFLSNLGFTIAA